MATSTKALKARYAEVRAKMRALETPGVSGFGRYTATYNTLNEEMVKIIAELRKRGQDDVS